MNIAYAVAYVALFLFLANHANCRRTYGYESLGKVGFEELIQPIVYENGTANKNYICVRESQSIDFVLMANFFCGMVSKKAYAFSYKEIGSHASLDIDYSCYDKCEGAFNMDSCFKSATSCSRGLLLYCRPLSQGEIIEDGIPKCLNATTAAVRINKYNEFDITDGKNAFGICTNVADAETVALILCEMAGLQFFSFYLGNPSHDTNFVKFNSSCLHPCRNSTIGACLETATSSCALESRLYARCIVTNKTASTTFDSCAAELAEHRNLADITKDGEFILYDGAVNQLTYATVGFVPSSRDVLYQICVDNKMVTDLWNFGDMVCGLYGLDGQSGYAIQDLSPNGSHFSLNMTNECLSQCLTKSEFELKQCITAVGRCKTKAVLRVTCYPSTTQTAVKTTYTCPNLHTGRLFIQSGNPVYKAEKEWYVCSNGMNTTRLACLACVTAGFPGIKSLTYQKPAAFMSRIVGLNAACLSSGPEPDIRKCLTLPPKCAKDAVLLLQCMDKTGDQPTFTKHCPANLIVPETPIVLPSPPASHLNPAAEIIIFTGKVMENSTLIPWDHVYAVLGNTKRTALEASVCKRIINALNKVGSTPTGCSVSSFTQGSVVANALVPYDSLKAVGDKDKFISEFIGQLLDSGNGLSGVSMSDLGKPYDLSIDSKLDLRWKDPNNCLTHFSVQWRKEGSSKIYSTDSLQCTTEFKLSKLFLSADNYEARVVAFIPRDPESFLTSEWKRFVKVDGHFAAILAALLIGCILLILVAVAIVFFLLYRYKKSFADKVDKACCSCAIQSWRRTRLSDQINMTPIKETNNSETVSNPAYGDIYDIYGTSSMNT